ncbi:MAG TPA: hypothetical protein VNQ33_03300 [Acidimicrobiales bacterium]|nr:hypothetical protein [Acidimicrobiales bacterium]
MQSEQFIAKGIAIGRVAYGVACMAAPRAMLGPSGPRAEGSSVMMARFFGVRDLVLGGGTLLALQRDPDAAVSWVEWSAAADALDVAVGIASHRDLDRAGRFGVAGIALPAALGGAWAARRLRAAR